MSEPQKKPRNTAKKPAKKPAKTGKKTGKSVKPTTRKPSQRSTKPPAEPAETPPPPPSPAVDLADLERKIAASASPSADPKSGAGYVAHRARVAERARQQSTSSRDIGPIPPCANPERRAACERDFKAFCETYLAQQFPLAWSPDHLRLIEILQLVVLSGGNLAFAMPRGSGKTTLCIAAALWALLYAHRRFVVLVGAAQDDAEKMIDSLTIDLQYNDLLAEDFPEVCVPIRALEGINQRSAGQLSEGERTNISITADSITLPTIRGSRASGSRVDVKTITGSIRGLQSKTLSGEILRPDLLIIDDPQTDASARSESQCADREVTIKRSIMNLGGPGKRVAAMMPCTVIRKGDLADRFLDRSIYPDWRGERAKLLYSLPSDEALWEKYAVLYRAGREAGDISQATAFYVKHRAKMDKGAVAAWAERYVNNGDPVTDEASAVQHAMNLKILDEEGFWAEYQNEPRSPDDDGVDQPDAAKIVLRLNRLREGVAPADAMHVVAFIDVGQHVLHYMVAAFTEGFGGAFIRYGTDPEQPTVRFNHRAPPRTLSAVMPGASLESQIYGGLERLTDRIFGADWKTESGVAMPVERCLIDAGWGMTTDVVYKFIRQSRHRGLLLPSHGVGITASKTPMREWQRKPGEKKGLNWIIRMPATGRAVRHILHDANYWRSFLHNRLSVPLGDASALSLFGKDPERHRFLAEHLACERRVRTSAAGREVDEWRLPASGPPNHWFDCGVGCCVAASTLGVRLVEVEGGPASRGVGGAGSGARGGRSWSQVFEEKRRRRSGAA